MKNYTKLLFISAIAFSFVSCGEKKETDPMGNPIEEKKTTTQEFSSTEYGKEYGCDLS